MGIRNNPLDEEYLSADDVLLVPRFGVLSSRKETDIKPFIFSAPMDTVTGYDLAEKMLEYNQFPVVSRFIPESEYLKALEHFIRHPNCFFAVGARKQNAQELLRKLETISSSLDNNTKINIAVDVAHGDSVLAHKATQWFREQPFISNIMSGSICTPGAAKRAIDVGCTHLRIGLGCGSVCSTRQMTGIGVPQLSAIYWIYQQTIDNDVCLIADGGIKHPGDAVKYLSVGANAIMLGSVLSKCRESAGWIKEGPSCKLIKSYRGQASAEFQKDIYGYANACPEGESSPEFQWSGLYCQNVIDMFYGGVSSALSYLGLRSLDMLGPETVNFIKQTHAAYIEGTPYGALGSRRSDK